jgi:hypothetical protein
VAVGFARDGPWVKAFPLDRHFRNALVTPVPVEMARLWEGPELVTLRGSWTDPRTTFVGLKATGGLMGHDQCDAGTFVLDALGQAWAEEQGNPGLVYLPHGGEATVDLSAAPGPFVVEWFHPETGSATVGGTTPGGVMGRWRAPFEGTAVLRLKAN